METQEAQGERLLQELVNYEQGLVSKIEQAKVEAAEMVTGAEARAKEIQAKASQKAEQLAEAQAEKTQMEVEEVRREVLEAAEREVAALEARGRENVGSAAKFVLERVLP